MPHYICGPDTCPWEHESSECPRYGSAGTHRTIRLLWWREQQKQHVRRQPREEGQSGE